MPSTSKPAIVFCHGLWARGFVLQQSHSGLADGWARSDRCPVRAQQLRGWRGPL